MTIQTPAEGVFTSEDIEAARSDPRGECTCQFTPLGVNTYTLPDIDWACPVHASRQLYYSGLAARHGWTVTQESIMGQPCWVYQRGREIAVWWPDLRAEPGVQVLRAALYNGRVIGADLANYLVASPPRQLLSQHIEGDLGGIIAHLAAMSAERLVQARTAGTQREARRLSDESSGLDLAIHVLQAWEETP